MTRYSTGDPFVRANRHPIRGRSRTQSRVSPARPRTTTRDGITRGMIVYRPVLWKLDTDKLFLTFLPSQVWPGPQQRPVALLQQIQPFGQQTETVAR